MEKNLISEKFVNEYWQKKPYLFEAAQALDYYPISIANVIKLLQQEEVESSVVITEGDISKMNYKVLDGPFDFEELKSIEQETFNYLVHDANHEFLELNSYYNMFRGLASWQQSDVLISYSSANGSVGPHSDRYDVFLWQIHGERKWYFENDKRTEDSESINDDLDVLPDFKKENEIILKPGDILYVPPNVAHWGLSQSESLSLSYGFKRPSVYDFLIFMLSEEINLQSESNELLPAPELFGNYEANRSNQIKDVYSNAIIKLVEEKIKFITNKIQTEKSEKILAKFLGEESTMTEPYEDLPLDDSMMLNSTLEFFPGFKISYTVDKEVVNLYAGFKKFSLKINPKIAEYLCTNKTFTIKNLLKIAELDKQNIDEKADFQARNKKLPIWECCRALLIHCFYF